MPTEPIPIHKEQIWNYFEFRADDPLFERPVAERPIWVRFTARVSGNAPEGCITLDVTDRNAHPEAPRQGGTLVVAPATLRADPRWQMIEPHPPRDPDTDPRVEAVEASNA